MFLVNFLFKSCKTIAKRWQGLFACPLTFYVCGYIIDYRARLSCASYAFFAVYPLYEGL